MNISPSQISEDKINLKMKTTDIKNRYLYWFKDADFVTSKQFLEQNGYRLTSTLLTPCQVLKSRGRDILYAPPKIWSRMCFRQGSWYRTSDRQGQTMLMSDHRLPESLDPYFDAEMVLSDFQPDNLPDRKGLQEIVDTDAYQNEKPDDWEKIGIMDSVMFKVFFSLTRFWGLGEGLKEYWLNQRSNHANFVSGHLTTEIDGQPVPYSVTENAGVCSSCAEFFNVVKPDSRKLVRSCPGAITFGKTDRDVYYDIKPKPLDAS